MTVGIDATDVVFDNTKRGKDIRQTIEALSASHPHQQYMLYTPGLGDDTRHLTGLLAQSNIHIKEPKRAPLFRNRWRSGKGILFRVQRHHVHVFHGIGGILPSAVKKMDLGAVVTIDNLAFKHRPQDYCLIERWSQNRHYRKACKLADVVVVPSECTKRDVMRYYGVKEKCIQVIHPCCSKDYTLAFDRHDIDRVRGKYELPHHYLLCVAPFEKSSNLELAFEAIQHVQKRGMMLVMIGHRNDYYEQCKKHAKAVGASRHLYRISHVHDEDLPVICALADATLHTWHYAGSATSLLESMTCGTPAIATKGSCMEEIGGDAAIYIDPDDPQAMGDAINLVLSDEHKRNEMISNGFEQVKKFSAQKMADALNAIYHELRDR